MTGRGGVGREIQYLGQFLLGKFDILINRFINIVAIDGALYQTCSLCSWAATEQKRDATLQLLTNASARLCRRISQSNSLLSIPDWDQHVLLFLLYRTNCRMNEKSVDVTWFQPLKVHDPDLETACWSPLKGLPSSGILGNSFLAGLPAIHLHHFVLVDVLEDVRCVDENADSTGRCHGEEDVQLQTIDHHGNVLPILANLRPQVELNMEQNKWSI